MILYWQNEYEEYEKNKLQIHSRFDRAEGILGDFKQVDGDHKLDLINDIFINGFGIKWSAVQLKIWNAILDAILPLIYGKDWDEVKARVLKKRKLEKVYLEVLVNMARRNGKTWIVSGACVAIFLVLKGITIAIFSVGKRQSGLFLTSCGDKLKSAFQLATHVKESDYKQLQKNQEVIIFETHDGYKNTLQSLPGSIKVTIISPCVIYVLCNDECYVFFIAWIYPYEAQGKFPCLFPFIHVKRLFWWIISK
jgi:hypothetical protein